MTKFRQRSNRRLHAVKFERTMLEKNKVLFTNYDMVQSEITWVRNGINYDSSLVPVIELYNAYFGGGMGSLVFAR